MIQSSSGNYLPQPARKKSWAGLLLLLLLLPFGMTCLQIYHENRQQARDRALLTAVQHDDIVAVRAALSQGADPNTGVLSSRSSSAWQRLWGRLQGETLPPDRPATALLIALAPHADGKMPPENVALIEALLKAKARVNVVGINDETPLMWAVQGQKRATVGLLLQQGARIEARDVGGFTPLHSAVLQADPSIVQLLLARGAIVNTKNRYGKTPLHAAAAAGRATVVRLLLAHGGDVEARDGFGIAPLAEAVKGERIDAVRLLLASGAQVNSTDGGGQTPLHWARQSHNAPLTALLQQAGAHE
jgi:ankyrin repeat protein